MQRKKRIKNNKSIKSTLEKYPVVPKQTKKNVTANLAVLNETFENDEELVLFFLAWMKNDRNATKAYQEIHKNVSYGVAAVMGGRLLKKVKNFGGVEILLEAYGVGVDTYLTQLRDGLQATIRNEVIVGLDDDGAPILHPIEDPDHKTRRHYHKALGQMLGVEGPDVQINNQNNNLNNNQNLIDNINDDELDDLIS